VEIAPVAVLLLLCVALTVEAGDAMRYLDGAAHALHEPSQYVDRVLGRR
jgi:multicomponent K+:H+ antiporter subunit D